MRVELLVASQSVIAVSFAGVAFQYALRTAKERYAAEYVFPSQVLWRAVSAAGLERKSRESRFLQVLASSVPCALPKSRYPSCVMCPPRRCCCERVRVDCSLPAIR